VKYISTAFIKLRSSSIGFVVLSLAASGCVLTRGQSLKAEAAPPRQEVTTSRQETTPSPWHNLLVSKLSNEPGKYKDAWALFSSGGWADAGQILVLGDSASKRFHVYLIKPGASEISSDHQVSAEDFDKILAPAIKSASELNDLAPVAFDALTFYYEHASVGGDGKVVIAKRLIIRPTMKTKSPQHDALVTAFQKIR
jgi:hypothetical protein